MAEGVEVGKAYITISLDDTTESDYENIKTRLEAEPPVSVKAKLETPDVGTAREEAQSEADGSPDVKIKSSVEAPDVTKAREEAQAEADAEPDVKIKAKVDESILGDSIKKAGNDAVPAAEEAGAKVGQAVGDSSGKSAVQYGTQRMGEMATVYTAAFLALSPIIGGALISGATIGTAAIAGIILKSNTTVAGEYQALTSTIRSTFVGAANQLAAPIVNATDMITNELHTLAPGISQAFAAAGPAIIGLATGVNNLASNALPGFQDAMKASGTVVQGFDAFLGDLGTAFSQTMSLFSSNSSSMSRSLQSFGSVVLDVFNIVSHVANAAASAWAAASGAIDPALHSISQAVDGLASGALPVFGQVLKVVATDVNFVVQALGPLTPVIGAVLAGFLAYKAITPVINAVGNGITALGSATVSGADKIAEIVAKLQGLPAEASAAAGGIQAFGDSVAATSADVGMLTSSLAGPLGVALLAGTALISLFTSNTQQAGSQTQDLSSQIIQLGNASQSSAQSMLSGSSALQAINSDLKNVGSSSQQFAAAFSGGVDNATQYVNNLTDAQKNLGSQMGQFSTQLQEQTGYAGDYSSVTESGTKSIKDLAAAVADGSLKMSDLSPAVQQQITDFNSYSNVLQNAQSQLKAMQAVQDDATNTANTVPYLEAEASTAKALGIGLNDVSSGYQAIIAANPSDSLLQVGLAFDQLMDKVQQAENSISTTVQQNAQSISQARQGLVQANQSYQQSVQAVANAEHSASDAAFSVTQAYQSLAAAQHTVLTSQQSLQSAQQGVTNSEFQLTQAQLAQTQAQVALNTATKEAAQNLINLQLQQNDQTESTQAANLALFNQQIQSAALGVTSANAQAIAAQQVTSQNAAQIQAALNLIAAQNALADAQNQLTQTQQQNTLAQQQGIAGNPNVISAQQALVNANQQVVTASEAVVSAQQSEQNAEFSLQQAVEGVTNAQHSLSDSEYSAQQATLAITQARQQEANALYQVKTAQENLNQAVNNGTIQLDGNNTASINARSTIEQLAQTLQASNIPVQDQYNQLIQNTATLFGTSSGAAQDWLKNLNLIPKNWNFAMTAEPVIDPTQLNTLEQTLKVQYGITGISGTTLSHKDGGYISGAGGPRDDKIPAMLSNGEYVVNADATSKHMGLLNYLNAGHYANGGVVSPASVNLAGATADAGYQITVDAMKVFGLPTPPDLPQYVAPPAGTVSGSVPSVPSSRAANEQIVQSVFASMFGWTGPEWAATIQLLMQESGFNNTAQNPTSTAYGMFQFLNSTWAGYGIPKTSDPTQQSIAGGRYIKARYGDPIGAEAHERAYHWFENGGYLMPGATLSANGTGRPEMVLPPSMTATMEALDSAVQSGRPTGSAPSVTNNTVNVNTIAQSPAAVGSAVVGALTWAGRSKRG